MNSYLKYGPLIYTYITHYQESLVIFLYENIIFNTIPIVWGFFTFTILGFSNFIVSCVLLVGFFILYEIGYIINDFYTIKREKNPTRRLPENTTSTFIFQQCFIRSLIGAGIFIFLYQYNIKVFILYWSLIIITGLIFSIHNYIRNYNINLVLIALLRYCKMFIPYTVLFWCLPTVYLPILKETLLINTVIFFTYQSYFSIFAFNPVRFGGINKIPHGILYFYMMIICCVLYLITLSWISAIFFLFFLIKFIRVKEINFFTFKNR